MAGYAMFASLGGGGKAYDRQADAYAREVGKAAVKFEKGTLGHAQFAYTTKRTKAEREAAVAVLAGLKAVTT